MNTDPVVADQTYAVPVQPPPSMEPTPIPVLPPTVIPKHFLAAFFLSFFLGVFGADRFYLGKYGSGIVKFLTFGLFGIGAIVDLALIMNGAMRDSHDRPLAGYEDYKGLAKKTVAWVTAGVLVLTVLTGISFVIFIQLLISHVPGGDFTKLINGGLPSGGTGTGGSSLSLPYSL